MFSSLLGPNQNDARNEMNTDVSVFTGGARIGQSYWASINYTWPFASLTILENEIKMRTPFATLTFNRTEIIEIVSYRGVISDGIQIKHQSSAPNFVVFWATSEKVADGLKSLNYPYLEAPAVSSSVPRTSGVRSVITSFVFCAIFAAWFADDIRNQKGIPDAMLDATVLTLFMATIYYIVRKRVLR
jgi:hypothetical protein